MAVLLALCLPEQASFYILGLRLTLTRLIFLLLTPMLIAKSAQRISSGRYRYSNADLLFLTTGIWMILAPANIDGLIPALNHAGPEVLEFCVAYMATRVLLSEHGHALAFTNLLCRVISVVAWVGLLDTITGRYFTHELAQRLSGYVQPGGETVWADAYRLGFLRAAGPMEHPIWFGFICVIGLLLAISTEMRYRKFIILSSSIGVIAAISSAPIQCFLLGIGLFAYDRILKNVTFRWSALIGAAALAMVTIYVVTNSPIGFIISHFTLDPSSGYYRVYTWDMVTPYISQSPWFGLGFGLLPEEINHSIDELWLVLAIHYGWPGSILVGLSIIVAGSARTRGAKIKLTEAERKLGTTLGIVTFLTIYLAFTVDILGILWTLTGLLAGVSVHLGELGRLGNAQRSNAAPRPLVTARYTDLIRPSAMKNG